MQLLVGLGNPGKRYQGTRHNVGARFVQACADELGTPLRDNSKLKASLSQVTLAGSKCILAVPTTYMNESGRSLLALRRYYNIELSDVLVLHDDIDLPLGRVRLKQGGGHGGHNGLRDIIQHAGGAHFMRGRFGVSHPGHADDVSDYVLGSFKPDEQAQVEAMYQHMHHALPILLQDGLATAMQTLHTSEDPCQSRAE